MAKSSRKVQIIIGACGLVLGGLLLFDIFRNTDFSRTFQIIGTIGTAGIFLLFIPSIAGALFDAFGWKHLLPESIIGRTFWRMMRVRTAAESVVCTVPLGAVAADPLKAWLIKRHFGVSLASGTASVALRTFLLGQSQSVIVLVVALAGFSWLTTFSYALLHNSSLSWLTVAVSAATLVIYTIVMLAASMGSLTRKLHDILTKIPFQKIRSWFEEQEVHFHELNTEFASFGKERTTSIWYAFGAYIALWSMEGLETYVILRLIGSPLPLTTAYALEAICSFIRSLAFFIPSGLGAQDAGYVGFLSGSGLSHPTAIAFILIKRLRQLVWIAVGFVILFAFETRPRKMLDV